MRKLVSQNNLNHLKRQFFNKQYRTFTLKNYNSTVTFENNKTIAKLRDSSIEIKQPLEMLLGVLGTCEIHTLEYIASKNKVVLDKIEIKINGEYDSDIFLGVKQGRNTYSKIDVEINVNSKELDRNKLQETVQKGLQMCPVANTIRYAGIIMNEKINYL